MFPAGSYILLCLKAVRQILKRGGVDLTGRLTEALAAVPERRYANSYLLGVLARGLPIKQEHWIGALDTVFKGKNTAENERIFLLGFTAPPGTAKGDGHDLE